MNLPLISVPYEAEARRLWEAEKATRRAIAEGRWPSPGALEDATMIREMTDRPLLARRASALTAEVFVHAQVAS